MQGKAVVISPEEEKMHVDLFRSNGFSGFASDKVGLKQCSGTVSFCLGSSSGFPSKKFTVPVPIPRPVPSLKF
jgi:hypothetical protein